MAEAPRPVAPWVLGGCALGCLGLTLLVVAGGGLATRWVRDIAEQVEDPERAAERALDVFGAETLPDGWTAEFALALPFLGDFVALQGPLRAGADPDDPDARWGLFYLDLRDRRERPPIGEEEVSGDRIESVLEERGIQVDSGTTIDRGVRRTPRHSLHYMTGLGRARQGGSDRKGVVCVVEIRCRPHRPGRIRLGVLTVEHPEAVAAGAFDPRGTPADPDRLAALFDALEICPAP